MKLHNFQAKKLPLKIESEILCLDKCTNQNVKDFSSSPTATQLIFLKTRLISIVSKPIKIVVVVFVVVIFVQKR